MYTITFCKETAAFEGEEIEITRGYWTSDSSIDAKEIKNITRGGIYKCGGGTYQAGSQIREPLIGFVKDLEIGGYGVRFQLDDKMFPPIGKALRTIRPVLDEELFKRTFGKGYDDTAFNAFKVVEERIRLKIDDKSGLTGKALIDAAFNADKGKLILGDTDDEKTSVYMLFRGANGFFRNPVAHKYIDDEGIAAFEVVCLANKLLSLVEKASIR